MDHRPLGRSGLDVSVVGLGCWQFSGKRGFAGGYWATLSQDAINEIVAASLAGGVTWFDTAEMYGAGASESSLAAALVRAGRRNGEVVVATKWWPVLRTALSIRKTVEERISLLKPFAIDLYQIHHPFALSTISAQARAMAALVKAGRIRAVGVSNFRPGQMRTAQRVLGAKGIPLASNQVRYSLLDRRIERNGVLETARELGVSVIAYSPLAQGLLTGKFHKDPDLIRSRPGPRRWMNAFRYSGLEKSRTVIDALQEIAKAHGATSAQVALRWVIQTQGDLVTVIPGASSVEQARENAATAELLLSDAECGRLEELSRPFR